jgi:Tfp pilus assembly protein PilN
MKIDINLLPQGYRPKYWILLLTVGLVLIILAAGYYGYGFYERNVDASSELERLQSQLDLVNAEITKELSDTTIEELQSEIVEVEAEIEELKYVEKEYEKYNSERIYWKPVLQAVREMVPTDVIITSFRQTGNQLTVEGELLSGIGGTIPIVEYARKLEARADMFSRVVFDIFSEERPTGIEDETEEVFIFTMILQVRPGG